MPREREAVSQVKSSCVHTVLAAQTMSLRGWLDWAGRNATGACDAAEEPLAMLPPHCQSAASDVNGRWGAAPHGFHVSERCAASQSNPTASTPSSHELALSGLPKKAGTATS